MPSEFDASSADYGFRLPDRKHGRNSTRLPDIAKDQDVWPLVDQLIEDQAPDGSWSSPPMLRVTRRDCLDPWKPGDPDPLFRDQNRLFTTATVIDAFSNLHKLL